MFNVNFSNVTPAPVVVEKPFAERFVEEMEKEPYSTYLSFYQTDDYLMLRVTFNQRGENGKKEKVVIEEGAYPELIEAVLSAFCTDFSKVNDFDKNNCQLIVADDDERLCVEMFKQFLYSPYKQHPEGRWEKDNGEVYYCISFHVYDHCHVRFCLPNPDEMIELRSAINEEKLKSEQVEQ